MKSVKVAGMVLCLAFCGLFLPQMATAQIAPEAAIRAVLESQQKAWNDGNVDVFLEGYWRSDELTFSGSSGVARGFNAVRERYKKSYPDRQTMGKLDFSQLEIRILDKGASTALVLGHWHLAREKGDVGGVFSLVFQRFPDGWRIVHDHTSVVTPTDSH
jgi:beta-aspartyl-peptidase (threonine type)